MTIEQRYEEAKVEVLRQFARTGPSAQGILDAINFRAYLKMEEAARKCKPGYLHPDIVTVLAELDGAK